LSSIVIGRVKDCLREDKRIGGDAEEEEREKILEISELNQVILNSLKIQFKKRVCVYF
jgi:hypothetical protein